MTAPAPHHAAASPHVMTTYGRLPLALSHGQGCKVWDTEGREYLDALGGIAVNTLGHNHPDLVAALQDQVSKLIHTSNYYHVPLQEALEAALKLARKFGHDKGIHNPQIVVFDKAFHGRSIATLSATGNTKVQAGFGPLVEGFIRVPLNNIEALKAATQGNSEVVAVFVEAIQGEGGVKPLHMDYLRDLRALCDARDWLLMIDEVQCGMGRTGKWFAHQWAGIMPDVMPLAKGLGSGVPIGAIVAGPRAAKVLGVGNHGSTFGGNPLAMRAGLETIGVMERDGLLANAEHVGAHLKAALTSGLAQELAAGSVKEIRGQGLMLGIELSKPCSPLMQQAADKGLLISVTADSVVRLVPSLVLTAAEAEQIAAILCPLITAFLAA